MCNVLIIHHLIVRDGDFDICHADTSPSFIYFPGAEGRFQQ